MKALKGMRKPMIERFIMNEFIKEKSVKEKKNLDFEIEIFLLTLVNP
jgi:hypothetical protein